MHWYFDVLKKYADFSGRSRRMEFWMFTLISTIIYFIFAVIDSIAKLQLVVYEFVPIPTDPAAGTDAIQTPPIEFGILASIYWLAVLIPSISVTARRLHDIGRSGWWQLLNLICCVGWIVVFVFEVMPGTQGDNQYGPDPLQEG